MGKLFELIVGLTVMVFPLLAAGAEAPSGDVSGASSARPAAVIPIQGEITEYTRENFMSRLDKARAAGAKTIIIELNTPGGLVTSTLDICHTLRNLPDIKTIAYINSKAYSAGTMIAIACDQIIMAPSAVIGDCAPIAFDSAGNLKPLPVTERAKAVSPVLADFFDSAARNGYEPFLVEAMVRVEPSVYLLVNEKGEYKGADEEQYKKIQADAASPWKLAPGIKQPVDGPDTLLTVSTSTAQKLGLARGQAANINELAQTQNLTIVATLNQGAGDRVLEVLASPIVRGLLLTVFLMCLYAALHAPGHGMAEVIGVVTLALLIGVPLLTGYAQWWEIGLILVGIGLLALEIFVIPGFGVTGILGLVCLGIGFLMTFVAPEPGRPAFSLPTLETSWDSLRHGLYVLFGGLCASLMLFMWLRRYLPKLPYFNGLILNTSVGSSEGAMVGSLSNIDPATIGPAIGASGKAVTDLKPGGSAEFLDPAGGSHVVAVISDSGYVARGTPLTVLEVSGNRVLVRPGAAEREG